MITLNRRERMTLAVGAAVLLTLPAVHPLYDDGNWALRCIGGVLAITVVGFLGRVLRLPVVLQPLLGVLTLLFYVTVVFAGETLSLVVPTADTFRVIGDLLSSGSDDISTLITPVPTTEGLVLIGVLATGAVTVVVDTLAVVLGRAALAGLPLLLLFAAPAAIGNESAGWWTFALAGAGWLLLLLAEGTERVHRWGVALSAPGTRAKAGGGLGYAGSRIGVLAVAVAVALPFVLPDVGDASGNDGGDGPRTITTYNPLTRLKGELSLPDPRPILSYSTDDPTPDYLRMTTLEVYDGEGWKQRTLSGTPSRDGVRDRTLPTPEGLEDVTATDTITARIAIASLEARWLPAPATPSEVDVEGTWMWDQESDTVFATRTDTNSIAPYTVTSTKINPTADTLRMASPELPEGIRGFAVAPAATSRVKAITAEVIRQAEATTAYGKAKALQDYFRSPQFTYSLRTVSGSSPDALENFLNTKQGYCEQYASAMAAMLRLAGVPSRVAVGFTTGQQQQDGTRLVTTSNAHAWPEAWIAGAGWTRFEPTPSQGFAPDYTAGVSTQPPVTSTEPSAAPSAGASASPQQGESLQEQRDREEAARALAGGADGGAGSDGSDGGGASFPTGLVLSLLLVVAVLSTPGGVHLLRRRARWQDPSAAAAWAQIGDDTFDVGMPLDPSRSPRQVLAGLGARADLAGEDLAALERVALAVERDRYAPSGAVAAGADLERDTTTLRAALHAPLTRLQRFRLLALPPSTVRWAADGIASAGRSAFEGVAQLTAGLAGRARGRLRRT